ncbi:MAG: hypothetical protein AAB522_03030 [Patescibacteria group bacterium]
MVPDNHIDHSHINHIIERDIERKRRKKAEYKEMNLRQYIDLVKEDPKIPQLSPERLLEIIEDHRTEDIPEHERWLGADKRYLLFSKELFGMEAPTNQVVKHIINGAMRASSGKYVLQLVGPTSSGKSTFATILKKALEHYSKKPVFMIKGCPIHEEPLNALPRYLRKNWWDPAEHPEGAKPIEDELGIPPIEGDLCPVCRDLVINQLTEASGEIRWWDLPVETFTFSIQGVRGIGSFEASADLAQDESRLIGRENIQITSTKGYDHPKAFELNGEVEKANRGILEAIEDLKPGANIKIIRVFISLAEEKKIKVQGSNFPHLYIDTFVLGHCNIKEFKEFSADQNNAALHDRMFVVPFPYTLRVKDEILVYKKLIERDSDFRKLRNIHIPDATYMVAAVFAVLTRLNDSPKFGVDRLKKLKAYNGESVLTAIEDQDKHPIDVRSLVEEWQNPDTDIEKREGMFGISYRDVLTALNTALASQKVDGCLTPLTAIRALYEVFEHRMGYTPEEVKRFRELLTAGEASNVMSEYKDFVVKTVTKAFVRAYDDIKKSIIEKYCKEVRMFRAQNRKFVRRQLADIERDPITGKPIEPDLGFMKSIEKHMGVSESSADIHRGEFLEYLEANPNANYEPLDEAAEKKLVEDNQTNIIFLLDPVRPRSEEEKRRAKDLFDGLRELGFCDICGKEVSERFYEFKKS